MSNPFFPPSDWRGQAIVLSSVPWQLGDKLGETVDQMEEFYWHEKSEVSEAWATFTCSNMVDGSPGIMKIRMQ